MRAPRSERIERIMAALTIEDPVEGPRRFYEAMEKAKLTGEAVPITFTNEKGDPETAMLGIISPRASAIKAFRRRQAEAAGTAQPAEESGWSQVKQGLRLIAEGLGL